MSQPLPEAARRPLNIALVVGIADALLLVVLVYFSRWGVDNESVVSLLGPIHGFGFLVLLYLTGKGAAEKLWTWWFPVAVLVTGGPLGTIVGDLILRRRLPDGVAA
ncbi:MAG: DUF3817 domain-containing protein [Solirubrobacteraceae bacterium]|nr:DUF3817 domain-containing protein [Solirubrobacteraceae bacterium]